MRIRQILLVHPTRSIRALIKKYVYSELSDVEFVEAEKGESALVEANMQAFDVVIACTELADMSVIDLKARLPQTIHNSATPFIVISEDEKGADQETLHRNGFSHAVWIRLRPAELLQQINQVCNPRLWRKDKRCHIPCTKVSIHGSGVQSEASLINISKGGILVELITYAPDLMMRDDLRLGLRIPASNGFYDLSDIPCKLSRLNVTEWHPDNSPAVMRATFIFTELSKEMQLQLDQILQLALENKLGTADEEA